MIVIYILEMCPYCNKALALLKDYKIKHTVITIENTEKAKEIYKKRSKMNTFPQIFIETDKKKFIKIGGCDDLTELINVCNNIKNSNISCDTIELFYKLMYKK